MIASQPDREKALSPVSCRDAVQTMAPLPSAWNTVLDRRVKVRLVAWTMLGVGAACVLLAQVQKELPFLVLGVAFGLGWGIAIPVFSSLMFDFSPVRLRAFNTNLGMQMFQAGYFIGPFIGAPLVAHWGFSVLFDLCAAFCIGSSGLAFLLGFKARRRAEC